MAVKWLDGVRAGPDQRAARTRKAVASRLHESAGAICRRRWARRCLRAQMSKQGARRTNRVIIFCALAKFKVSRSARFPAGKTINCASHDRPPALTQTQIPRCGRLLRIQLATTSKLLSLSAGPADRRRTTLTRRTRAPHVSDKARIQIGCPTAALVSWLAD